MRDYERALEVEPDFVPARLRVVELLLEQSNPRKAFPHLEAPPVRVTGFDTPFPYTLENEYLPLSHRILPAILETARY